MFTTSVIDDVSEIPPLWVYYSVLAPDGTRA